ncbi:MAG: hypothetical protein KKB13_06275 [Chloroflexi bacterium]|nr:hypothetical protein [Chloroflexota bacterium]
MSKRKRRAKLKLPTRRVEQMPPGVFPSPAERERIIQRRDELSAKLIYAVVAHPGDPSRVEQLVQRYGLYEVNLVLSALQSRTAGAELIGEDVALYRDYRRAFARFGGARPFLNARQYRDLNFEHGKLVAQRLAALGFPEGVSRTTPSPRERELRDLVFVGVDFWADITPPAGPPRPADFSAPPPGRYDDPGQELLAWGWDLDEQRIAPAAQDAARWQPALPELARMALDEGLLHGWPGEPASWTPYYALHLLGRLRAAEEAGRLLALLDQPDDWLSDRLPTVWAQMGPTAEPPLWQYLDRRRRAPQKRGIVFLGLRAIAEAHPGRRLDIVQGLAGLLQRAPAQDAQANAYLVHTLERLHAVEAAEVISAAFEQGKIDLRIIGPDSTDFL